MEQRASRNKPTRKFMNGDCTPQEFHQAYAFPPTAICTGCRCARPAVRIITYIEAAEGRKRGFIPPFTGNPEIEAIVAKSLVQFKGPSGPVPFFRDNIVYACRGCRPALERVMAKTPSWMQVEVQEGPNPTNKVVFGYH